MRILVLNGVNLDVLGQRDPELYGGMGLSELETRLYEWVDGVILNPGAWAHYSWAIRDAVELFDVPVVEVHLSDVDAREEWRRFSVLDGLVAERIVGKGPDGYREALEFLAKGRA